MRHNKKFNHLGRTSSHRAAMLSNMATSLIMHKRIVTTLPKAKALRIYVEPIINRAKEDTTHSRRMVFSKLQDKAAVTELFQNIANKIGDRPGGYTRILKLGKRRGDDAMTCFIELVDYNEDRLVEKSESKSGRTRRSRRKKADSSAAETSTAKAPKAEVVEEPKEANEPKKAKAEKPAVEDNAEAKKAEDANESVATSVEKAEAPSTESEAVEPSGNKSEEAQEEK